MAMAETAGRKRVITGGGARILRQLEYHPQTFLQRGTVVPLTTRQLMQSRIRRAVDRRKVESDADRIEVLLPGFAGGSTVYVTALSQLDEIVKMSVHDRVILEMISEEQATTPQAVRRCWLEAVASGIGGAESIRRAEAWLKRSDDTFRADRILMLQGLAQRENIIIPDDLAKSLMRRGGDTVFRSVVGAFAGAGPLEPVAVETRVTAIARSLTGAGLPRSPSPGQHREMTSRLSEFAGMLTAWGEETLSDHGPTAILCANGASQVHRIAGICLATIDQLTADIPGLIARWPRDADALKSAIERLEWVLDGWEGLLDLWDGVVAGRMLAEDAIPEIERFLPVVPPGEQPSDEESGGSNWFNNLTVGND